MRITAGAYRGRRLRSPKGSATRPTSDLLRQAIFNVVGPRVAGARVLDLFAGTGALGVEALRGASHPEELVERALALEYAGLAVTDECSFAGSVRAHLQLKDLRGSDEPARSFRLIHCTELQLTEGVGRPAVPGARLVLLAGTRAGYGNLSQLVTFARRQAAKGSYRLSAADLESHAEWLQDVLALLVPSRTWREPLDAARAEREARWLAAMKHGTSWIACELTPGADDAVQLATLQSIGDATGLPLVAAGEVHMHVRRRRKLADVLTAVA